MQMHMLICAMMLHNKRFHQCFAVTVTARCERRSLRAVLKAPLSYLSATKALAAPHRLSQHVPVKLWLCRPARWCVTQELMGVTPITTG
jgi:hypothetical protein